MDSNRTRILVDAREADHNHGPDAAKIGAKAVAEQIRQRAVDTQEAPHQIIANLTTGKRACMYATMGLSCT